MKRCQPHEISVAERHGANSLTQTKGVHLGTIRCLQVPNSFPTEAGVAIQAVPIQVAEPAQGSDDFLQVLGFEAEEDILKLRTVQIQANVTTRDGHVRARSVLVVP